MNRDMLDRLLDNEPRVKMAVEITIDYNTDEVHIYDENIKPSPLNLTFNKPKTMKALEVLIVEILNATVYAKINGGVKLIKIDEDTRTTIDEW